MIYSFELLEMTFSETEKNMSNYNRLDLCIYRERLRIYKEKGFLS